MQNETRFLNIEEALNIHKELIETFGGSHGIRDKALLEAALMRPQTGYYQTINQQAAALMESLANNHPFIDGNKRIAFFVTDVFLRINSYWIDCDSEEAYEYFMQLFDAGSFRFEPLLSWLDTTIKPL
ncbi:MAG: type II toxin-antitoxin system death-on-curing family toxin [Methyloprofundus sp.]|nr:type II toxin-antitoxin system death-on-curing family toxin [Methyloprofundus sp.]